MKTKKTDGSENKGADSIGLFHKVSLATTAALFATVAASHASAEYGPAVWRPTCNANWYTSGYGTKFCVIHDMEGYYASVISWFTSCGMTSASVHYAVNGKQDATSDYPAGEVTQMISENYYAWHASCWNQWMYGTEHEGFASNPAWYTDAMYNATIPLQKHLAAVGDGSPIPMDRNHIIGHGEKSNANWVNWVRANYALDPTCNTHTDPGPYWDWPRLINGMNAPTTINPPYYFGSGTDGWTAGNSLTAPWWTGTGWPGVLVTDQTGADAYMHSPPTSFGGGWDTSINVNVYPQNGTTAGHDMQFFWKTGAENFWDAAKSSPMIGFTAKDQWIRVNLDASSAKWVGQNILQMRLDFDQNNQGVRWIVNHIIPQNTPKWWFDNSSSGTSGWTAGNSLTAPIWYNTGWPGIIYSDQTGPDAYFYSPTISYLGGANDKLFVKIYPQNGTTANHQVKVYWTTASDGTWTESKSSEIVYFTAQNAWADLGIRVGANPNWSSDFITRIRLDVDDVVNTQVRWIIDYVAIVPQTQQQTIQAVADIVVDNPSATITGTWSTGTSATDKFGADYRFKSKGTGSAYLQYTPNISAPGNYKVYEWHTQGSNRTTVAPHVITYNGGVTTLNVNQQVNGGTWNLLGTFNFATGTAGSVKITDGYTDAGSVVITDAIKFVYVP